MKTAVVYARYSSERQTEQSIEGQLRVCNEYAERNDIMIVDTYIDRAMTGTNDNRAACQQMMKDSSKKAWDMVLVYKLDRFSRDKYETAIHRRTLRNNGAKLVSAMENIPDTPEGIILESLLEGMNQYYSAELSQKVKRGMKESRSKGNFTGGFLAYGYKVINKKIVIDEDQAEIVRWAYAECATGKQIKDIFYELNSKGIPYKGGKVFSRSTVYRMLTNEKYSGRYCFNGELFTNIYPRIVPENVYSIVRKKITQNRYGKHLVDVCYLLKFKVRCGYCDKQVNSDAGTGKNGQIKRYYKCAGRRENKSCNLATIRKELLERIVIDTTFEALGSCQIENLADRILEANRKRVQDQSILNLLLQDFDNLTKSINNLLNAMEQGIVTSSTKERIEQLEERKLEIANKIAFERSMERLKLTREDIIKFIRKAIKKEPKQMIDLLIKEVKLYNDKVEIFYNYTDSTRPDGTEDHQVFSLCLNHQLSW